jgi:subtilisin family serine protease
LLPAPIVNVAGETEMDASTAGLTVSCAEPDTEPDVAAIVATPVEAVVANPVGPTATEATFDEDQVAEVETSCVDPSVYLPRAENCCVNPAATAEVPGETEIDTRTAGLTVSCAEPDTALIVAEIEAIPVEVVVASPPGATATEAIFDEDQVADAETSCVDPSAYLPRAEYCCVNPAATAAVPGVTVMDVKGGGPTVSVVDAEKAGVASFALMIVMPIAKPVASPRVVPEFPTEAIAGAEELHVTPLVTSFATPLLKFSMARNCCLDVLGMVAATGETDKETAVTEIPVPLRLTVCGEGTAPSFTVSVPTRLPAAFGVRVTRIWQEPFPGICVPQVLLAMV